MQRLNDNALEIIDAQVGLQGKCVLEIGCGNGTKTMALAQRCAKVVAIDPNAKAIETAKQQFAAANIEYEIGGAEKLAYQTGSFDIVLFSLSLHHVPIERINDAIEEAVRVVKPNGKLVFLEPTFTGSFFEAELMFGISDGDERKEKAAAYFVVLDSPLLAEESEQFDTVQFVFDSAEDFRATMNPARNETEAGKFLKDRNGTLSAERRINIFSVR